MKILATIIISTIDENRLRCVSYITTEKVFNQNYRVGDLSDVDLKSNLKV